MRHDEVDAIIHQREQGAVGAATLAGCSPDAIDDLITQLLRVGKCLLDSSSRLESGL